MTLTPETKAQLAELYQQLQANLQAQRCTIAEILYCCLKHLEPPKPEPFLEMSEARRRNQQKMAHKRELIEMLPEVIMMLDPDHDIRRRAANALTRRK